ncbi:MAG: DUF4012 domain-containing protein [Candidatus Cloacimonetes bacterium]|nr:DUF4012 domain-containing protein [Candidatus Cloacimonadota bacterium]
MRIFNRFSKNKTRVLPRWRIILARVFAVAILLGVLLYALVVRPLYADAKQGLMRVQNIKTALAEQNLSKLQEGIGPTKEILQKTKSDLRRAAFLSPIPFFGKYYQDANHLVNAGIYGVEAGEILTEALIPFADVLGFAQTKEESQMTAEQKLAQVVEIAPQLIPAVDQVTEKLKLIVNELSFLHPEIYPNEFRGINLKSQISNLKSQISVINSFLDDAKPLLQTLPAALGQPTPKTYLLLFQNDKELRPTGGFITAYALIKFDAGKFDVIESNDIYSLDNDAVLLPTPAPIIQFLKVKGLQMRDTNFKPDFKESMQDFEYYYERLNAPAIDGIIALDTQFVEKILQVSGPIEVPGYALDPTGFWNLPDSCERGGTSFTAENVICRLELYAQKINLRSEQRKAILGALMQALIDWVMNAPKETWQPLLKNILAAANEKHLLLYFHDETLQGLAEKYNFAGRLSEYDGDYLHINDANLAGLKSDLYMKRKIEQEISIADDGTATKKLKITYENTGEYDGWLNATNRNYVRVYVPAGSKLISFSGGELTPSVSGEFDKAVFDNFVLTKPLGASIIEFEYELPFKIKKEEGYKFLIQKQAGVERVDYTIKVDGQQEDFELRTDKEFTFNL